MGKREGGWGRGSKKAEERRVLRLTRELMENVEWWRWCLKGSMAGEGDRLATPFFRFVKQTHKRTWFSDASFEAVGGLCLEMRVCWRHNLSEGEVKRTIRSRKGGDRFRVSNILELLGMVMTAYVVIVIKRDRPAKEGESVLTIGDSS